ncbi:(2Fe-2S)-binding protein [Flexivirga caeni]|uniref:(2Fe-2S)-binding protein n=1 Tax=Flexivirga caeni TaxID=2294115 RepID=A0A3M9MIC9_9MICO|nr:(2Fe-2S)-binding protein [Flexivirga caeni]RNI24907.1 (2Fe-2S)-binding protein [Flexivirga caeni]
MNDALGLGPALAFDLHRAGETPSGDWQLLSALISERAVRDRVERTRDALTPHGAERIDARTAAATVQFGLVARLVAAWVCAQSMGRDLALNAGTIWWSQPPGGWLQLSFATELREDTRNPLQHGAITELTEAIHTLYDVSPHVLWGNVGSAANSTITLLRASRPDLVDAARAAADRLLTDPRVDGGTLRTGPAYRRASCCLIYRANGAICGDCVLQNRRRN